jgi:iron(III) transport system ATP-binding protein
VGLTGFERRYPHQLSGGQQQRVALARALAIKPAVVLLDEPFGSLDAALRESVRADVIAILAQTRTTTILVTHDQDEALSLADHIALLDNGTILAHGQPRDLYDHPGSPQIAAAIGTANILTGDIKDGHLECALGQLALSNTEFRTGTSCQLLLRPEQIEISTRFQSGRTAATVARIRYHGHDSLIDIALEAPDDPEVIARVTGETTLVPQQKIWITTTGRPHLWIGPHPSDEPNPRTP